mgnify:CR=1 FL=1
MNKELELIIKKIVLRDVEIKLKEARLEGYVIPDMIYNILKEIEISYEA